MLDQVPRTLSVGQIVALKAIRNQVITLLNSRRDRISMKRALMEEKEKTKELEEQLFKLKHLSAS